MHRVLHGVLHHPVGDGPDVWPSSAQRATQREVSSVRITMTTSGAAPGPSASVTLRLLPASPLRSTQATCPLGGSPLSRQGRRATYGAVPVARRKMLTEVQSRPSRIRSS